MSFFNKKCLIWVQDDRQQKKEAKKRTDNNETDVQNVRNDEKLYP